MLRNTSNSYGLVSILLHWLVALMSLLLFGLGLWMVELDYYDAWYQRAPELHKGTGVLLLGVMLARLAWRRFNPLPRLQGKALERRLAGLVHRCLYLLLFMVILSGYLISTADGRPIEVLGLFRLPATLSGLEGQEDFAGMVHEILAVSMIGLSLLHALAALKHHFIDHDRTLLRMLSSKPRAG